jgi:HAD superfamily hydrolase (TIGR01459 family)
MTLHITGLEEISSPFKAIILDAWGVLHNGVQFYPHVLETLTNLRSQGKKILVLSNAPRLKESVQESLLKCGIPEQYYDFLHSSGEEGYLTLKENNIFGNVCFHMGEIAHRGLFDRLSLERTENLDQAKFLLNTGFINPDLNPLSKDNFLNQAIEKNLLMLCFNPDMHVYVGDNLLLCAGTYAKRYEDLGGKVHYFGKPHANVYKRAMSMLNIQDPNEVLAVGDSFATDMRGGQQAGIKTILTLTGIHSKELHPEGLFNEEIFKKLCDLYEVSPTFVIPELSWSSVSSPMVGVAY